MPSRFEWVPHNRIGVNLVVNIGGVPINGLAATTQFSIERRTDGLFWDRGLNTFVAAPPTQTLVALSPTNFPGWYSYLIPEIHLDYELGQKGYRFVAEETTTGVYEVGRIGVAARQGGVWKELLADVLTIGDDDVINALFRMLALRQENMRFVPSAWDPTTRQPTAGLILVYETKADVNNDTGPAWALAKFRYTMAGIFDGSGQLTSYTSVIEP